MSKASSSIKHLDVFQIHEHSKAALISGYFKAKKKGDVSWTKIPWALIWDLSLLRWMVLAAWVVTLACSWPQAVIFRTLEHPIKDFTQCTSYGYFETLAMTVHILTFSKTYSFWLLTLSQTIRKLSGPFHNKRKSFQSSVNIHYPSFRLQTAPLFVSFFISLQSRLYK